MSDQYDIQTTEHEDAALNDSMDLHLVFRIEDEDYAINVAEVSNILQYSDIRKVPQTPPHIKGIMNIRGDIIPVICVRTKFMKPLIPYDDTCIVKVQYEEYALGLIVDSVVGVEPIRPGQISAPPSSKLNIRNQFIKSIGKTENGIRLIMSLDKLIF